MALSSKAELVLRNKLGNYDTAQEVATAINHSPGAALTTALTTISITDANSSPDYALSTLTTTSPYGLATQAEAISLLYVIQNLQNRVNDIETRIRSFNFIP